MKRSRLLAVLLIFLMVLGPGGLALAASDDGRQPPAAGSIDDEDEDESEDEAFDDSEDEADDESEDEGVEDEGEMEDEDEAEIEDEDEDDDFSLDLEDLFEDLLESEDEDDDSDDDRGKDAAEKAQERLQKQIEKQLRAQERIQEILQRLSQNPAAADDLQLRRQLMSAYAEAGQWQEAANSAMELLGQQDLTERARLQATLVLAQARALEGDTEGALALLEQYRLEYQNRRQAGDTEDDDGEEAEDVEDADEAEDAEEAGAAADVEGAEDADDAGDIEDELLEALGELKARTGSLDEALALLEESAQRDPADQSVYQKLGKLLDEPGEDDVKVFVKGSRPEFDVPPQIVEGRTLVPFRAVAEALDANVDWDPETNTVIVEKDGIRVELPVGQTQARVNGTAVTLDVPATLVNGRTMVPVRFLSEALQAEVEWDGNYQMVIVR